MDGDRDTQLSTKDAPRVGEGPRHESRGGTMPNTTQVRYLPVTRRSPLLLHFNFIDIYITVHNISK